MTLAPAATGWLAALDIPDLGGYDPKAVWAAHTHPWPLTVLLGVRTDVDGTPTEGAVTLDLSEHPVGLVQGMTGSGREELLTELLLGLCARYGPESVSLVLLDFTGERTFQRLKDLPHVTTYLPHAGEDPDRLGDLGGWATAEIVRRREQMAAVSKRHGWPAPEDGAAPEGADDLPPHLFVVADGSAETLHARPEVAEVFDALASEGGPLGIHLILSGPYVDTRSRGLLEKAEFGISLRTTNEHYSRVVVGVPDALDLPNGSGRGILRISGADGTHTLARFTAYLSAPESEALADRLKVGA